MPTSADTESAFPSLLKLARAENRESLRSLAGKAKVPHSYISSMEQGRRPVGQKVAAKLANALKLTGAKRDQFLVAAAQDSPRDRLVEETRALPAKILNVFAMAVSRALRDHDSIELIARVDDSNQPSRDLQKLQQAMTETHEPGAAQSRRGITQKSQKHSKIAKCFMNFRAEELPEPARTKFREQHPTSGGTIDLAVQLADGQWVLWEFRQTRV